MWMLCFVEAAECESKSAQEQLKARIVQLTYDKKELVTKWLCSEENLKAANECKYSVQMFLSV